MFYIHWLYRTSQYAIVKIDITENSYVTQLQDIVAIMYVADNCNQSDYIINKNSGEGVIAPAGAKVTGATIRTWLLNKFISFLAVLTWKTGLKKCRQST